MYLLLIGNSRPLFQCCMSERKLVRIAHDAKRKNFSLFVFNPYIGVEYKYFGTLGKPLTMRHVGGYQSVDTFSGEPPGNGCSYAQFLFSLQQHRSIKDIHSAP